MSLKTAVDPVVRPAWSLAARLNAWYAGSSFVLVLIAAGYLYWAATSNLDVEDDHLLGDRLRYLQSVWQNKPGDLPTLQQEIEEVWQARQHTQIHVRVVKSDGSTVLATPDFQTLLADAEFPEPMSDATVGADLKLSTGRQFRGMAASLSGDPQANVVQVAMDRRLEMELEAKFQRDVLLVIGISLVVCMVFGYVIAKQGLRPIHDITETAGRIRPSNLSERLRSEGLPAELLTLAETFNAMLARLEDSFVRLSRFSADLAHELRTPVFVLRGEMEVALTRPRPDTEYRDVLSSGLEECERLTQIIDRLLFLARAEHPDTEIQREACDIQVELEHVREFYEPLATEAGVRLEVQLDSRITAEFDRPLLQRAIGNLVQNAIAHTPPGGSVALTARQTDAAVCVVVADTGGGIAEEHLPRLFDRFYRVDSARASRDGAGLGLSIVKSIVELHGGTVAVTSQLGHGTQITMRIPNMTRL